MPSTTSTSPSTLIAIDRFEIGKYREAEKTLLSEGQELSDAVQFGAAGLNLLGRIFQ